MAKRESGGEASESAKKLRREIIFAEIKDAAEWLLEEVKQQYEKLEYKNLKDRRTWVELICPDMHSNYRYLYMGRGFTGKLLKFIVDEHTRLYSGRGDGMIKYITGTPGFGKTVSLSTAVAYLYLRSVHAAEAKLAQTAAEAHTTMTVEAKLAQTALVASVAHTTITAETSSSAQGTGNYEQEAPGAAKGKRWSPEQLDFSKLRFSLLSGEEFVENPCKVLHAGLVLAYIRDPEALAFLELVDSESEVDLFSFLYTRTETVHVVVDDANSMDINERSDSQSLRAAKESAWSFLRKLARRFAKVRVVICASVRTRLRKKILKEGAEFRLGTGRFSEEETVAYLMHTTGKSVEECRRLGKRVYRRTGWVPRLLSCYLLNKSSLKQMRKALLANVLASLRSENERVTVSEVLRAIAGGKLEHDLSEALDSACYFRGVDGKGQCLAPSLHDEAIAFVLESVKDRKVLDAYEQISHFTVPITDDNNLARIGWNAEAAVVLALRLLRVRIPGVEVVIDPDEIALVQAKELTRGKLAGARKKVLYIPRQYNHAGVAAYYQCPEALIVLQISVARDPKKCHLKTYEVAERLFEGESRAKVIVWNTASLKSSVEKPNAERKHYQVHVSFGELDGALAIIDKRVSELRKLKEKLQQCFTCQKELQGSISCDFCSDVYHKECVALVQSSEPWYCPDCRMAMGLDEDEDDAADRDADYLDEGDEEEDD